MKITAKIKTWVANKLWSLVSANVTEVADATIKEKCDDIEFRLGSLGISWSDLDDEVAGIKTFYEALEESVKENGEQLSDYKDRLTVVEDNQSDHDDRLNDLEYAVENVQDDLRYLDKDELAEDIMELMRDSMIDAVREELLSAVREWLIEKLS